MSIRWEEYKVFILKNDYLKKKIVKGDMFSGLVAWHKMKNYCVGLLSNFEFHQSNFFI